MKSGQITVDIPEDVSFLNHFVAGRFCSFFFSQAHFQSDLSNQFLEQLVLALEFGNLED